MKKYEILIERTAKKQLAAIQEPFLSNIEGAILGLANNPRPAGCKKLVNRPGYRIRVGNYRVIYSIEDKQLLILVIDIGHRQGVYK
jgi:mRNA interferase RelE/StbE